MIERNLSSTSFSSCQEIFKKIFTNCSEHYYKHLNIDKRFLENDQSAILQALLHVLGVSPQSDVISFPDRIISPPTFQLMVEIIFKIKLDIPVVLHGAGGSGKSTLVECVQGLYLAGGKSCEVVRFDPGLMSQTSLLEVLENKAESDVVFVVCQNDAHLREFKDIIHSRNVRGRFCESNVKFFVESSSRACLDYFDERNVIHVNVCQKSVKTLYQTVGILAKCSEVLLRTKITSFRNVINVIKAYSFIDQVIFKEHHNEIFGEVGNPGGDLEHGVLLKVVMELFRDLYWSGEAGDIDEIFGLTESSLSSFNLESLTDIMFSKRMG